MSTRSTSARVRAHLLAAVLIVATLPIEIVVDDPRNMPRGKLATTVVSNGRCVLTFTPESVRRVDVVAHEWCHCLNDADVPGPYGLEDISDREVQRREERAIKCARSRR